ncbi:MAG: glycosyltransferase [Actinomycetota bacterium]|nr:glycosyltransferase [Actinomycetota bacterium]
MSTPNVRVLRLITRLNIGGPARQALSLTKALAPEYPTMLAAGEPGSFEGELTDPVVHVHRLPLVREVRPAVDARAFRATRRLIRRGAIELVHTHMAKAGTIGRSAAWSVPNRPRLVHTFHGHVLDGYFHPAVAAAFIRMEQGLARVTDALVAVSPQIRDQLLDLGIGRPSRWHVIPLGFDLEAFFAIAERSGDLRRAINVARSTPLVGVVGRLVPIKDHETLFRAVAGLAEVHVVVLGDGELRQDLRTLVKELGMSERVHFVGWWGDMPSAMSDLDVVALTSRNEGSPVALIEALAAGVPVVATDVGGVRSVVEDGISGFVVPPGSPDAVRRALRSLLQDPELRRRFGAAGRQFVRPTFTHERLVKDVRSLYNDLLS